MNVKELKDKLAEYPDTMEVRVDTDNVKPFGELVLYEVVSIEEDSNEIDVVVIKL